MIYILYYFTYKDYIDCIHQIKQKDYLNLNEDTEKYVVSQNNELEIRYTYILECLFKDKERICCLINYFLKDDKIVSEKNLVYIEYTKDKSTIKIVYKNRIKNIFYLIIYCQEINLNLPYIILNYCMKIIQNCKKENLKHVSIIPIVIYVKDKNNCYDKHTYSSFKMTTYDNNILKLKYNLINLSKLTWTKKIKNTILEELIYIEKLRK